VKPRPATEDDFPAIAAFLAEDEEQLLGRRSRLSVADVQAWLHRTDLEIASWLFEEAGRIAAFGWAEPHGEVGVAVGIVGEEAKGRGLGSELVERSEASLRGSGASRVHQIALAADARAPALFAARGYREVRRFWEMAIDLEESPASPQLPDGMRIESFVESDARPFHDALDEAFHDHWEHHPRPFEEWWDEKRAAPDYDPTLWFLVRDGDEIAAVVRNDSNRNGGGWVGALGVRRAWRGLGLGRALLLHTFGEFHARGTTRVGLGVDAENATGATTLYERVGMRVDVEQIVYEKSLG
jgi:mycothiol synthase